MDTGSAYRVTLDVPGAHDDGLDIRPGPSRGTLSVTARTTSSMDPRGRPLILERAAGDAHRRVVPVAWDADVAAAKGSLDAGVLTVTVPKLSQPRPDGAPREG